MNDQNIYKDNLNDNVFLKNIEKRDVLQFDEYEEGDPYKVEKNLEKPFQKRRINITLEFLKKCVQKDSKILDLGCGEGHITKEFTKYVLPENIFACDCSVKAIKKAKNMFAEINFCLADVYDLPYKDNIFDVVVCNNIFEHLKNPLLAIAEAKRVLRQGGCLIISTPSRYRFENILNIFLGKKIELMSKYHITEYTVGQMKEMLISLGFVLVECRSYYISCESKAVIKTVLNILKIIFSTLTRIFKLDHIWESTAFFLFKKI